MDSRMFKHRDEGFPLRFNVYEVNTDMSNKEYHSRNEYSSSFVKNVHKHSVGRASVPPNEDSETLQKALVFGDAFHEFMELGSLTDRFIEKPEGMNFATKDGKAWKAENVTESRFLLDHGDFDKIEAMYKSVMSLEFLKRVLDSGDARDEWSFFAEGDDLITKGMNFRIRPDRHIVKDDKPIYAIDWKTTNDLPKLIKWGFSDLRYGVQDVMYSDMLGIKPENFLFVCVEKEYPYTARILRLKPDSVEFEREKFRESIIKMREYEISGFNGVPYSEIPEIIEL